MKLSLLILNLLTVTMTVLLPLQCADASAAPNPPKLEPATITILDVAQSAQARDWAREEIDKMTLRQRVAQLVVPRLDVTDNQAGRAAVKRMVDMGVGGLLFGKGTVADYAGLIAYAQSIVRLPLMITLDGEWGLKMRVTDAPQFPVNMALGAAQDMDAIEAYGAEVARECRAVGIHVNFAPVLDVNSNPDNPVIGYRSFGEDPERVARAGIAYSRGLEGGGVLSVAKHFPGHGDTSSDSHKTLPVVNHDRKHLNSVELLPFRRYIGAGLGGVMVGHISVPALDGSGKPASLSEKITTGLLRDDMKFEGLVFTDALAMGGAASSANNCVEALKAGTDVLLQPRSVKADIDAVVTAVEKGRLSRELIDSRCMKILQFKYALGLSDRPVAQPVSEAVAEVKSDYAYDVARQAAAASLTAVYNHDDFLPIGSLGTRRIAVVSIGDKSDCPFATTCADYASVEKMSVGSSGLTKTMLSRLREYDVVIAAVFETNAWAREAFASIAGLTGADRRVVGVFFMNPYKMGRFGRKLNELTSLVLVGDDFRAAQTVAAEGLFGGVAMTGRMPVAIGGVAKLGQGVSTPKVRLGFASPASHGLDPFLQRRIDSIMTDAVRSGAIPGGQVVVVKGGDVVVSGNYGLVDPNGRQAVTDSTIYDLASVTKPAATVTGLMLAYDRGKFKLDDRLSDAIEPLRQTDKSDITYREALYHTTGMPAMISIVGLYAPKQGKGKRARRELRSDLISRRPGERFNTEFADGLWLSDASTDTLMQHIYDAKLRTPGKFLYSDLNFCMLKEAEESLTSSPHDEWVTKQVYGPLGASTLGFCPKSRHYPLRHIAPTENDQDFRLQRLRGYVHDETAAVSGGVQGNAGLFGNALDLAKLCQLWLNGGSYGGEQLISERAVKAFTSPDNRRKLTSAKGATAYRGLGFAYVDEDSPAPATTYGHTGFTGTCFWVDPVNEIVMVMLSNRVCPSRKTPAFFRNDPRKAIMEAIYR